MNTRQPNIFISALAVLFLAVTSYAQPAYFRAVTNLNPVAYWPMHEMTPPAPGDIETNYGTLGLLGTGYYPDWAGGNNIATVRGTNGALAGDSDPAVYFAQLSGGNASSGLTNALYVPNTSPRGTLNPPFSVECWFYTDKTGVPGQGDIWGQSGFEGLNAGSSGAGQGAVCGTRLFWNATGIVCYSYKNASTLNNLFGNRSAAASVWHHVVVTCDATTNMSIYVDGAQAGNTVDASSKYAPDYWSPFEVGNGRGSTRPFGGIVDEVAIYPTNLSATTVANHHTVGLDPSANPSYFQVVTNDAPVIYLRMDGPIYSPPAVSTWPVATNYGSLALNGLYTPGTMPGIVNGPTTPAGAPYSGFAGAKVAQFSGVSSFVDGGYAPALDPIGAVPFTVSAVFRGNPCDNRSQDIIGHSDDSWRIGVTTAGKLQCQLGTNATSLITSAGTYNDGLWHQVVEVYAPGLGSGVMGTNSLYVDGVLDTNVTTVSTVGIMPGSPSHVLIAADPQYTNNPNGCGRQFSGQVCDVALFTNALTGSQIQTLYGALGAPPIITTQPISATVNAGVAFTNTVVATGAGLHYQWYRDNLPLPIGGQSNLPFGATNASLVINPVLTSDQSANYYIVITNSTASVTSAVVSLTVLPLPTFVSEPLTLTHTNNILLFAGATPTFKAQASGPQPMYYQWFTNGVAATANGTANSSYTLPPARLSGGVTSFYCAASNSFGKANSTTISVTVLADPTAPYPTMVLASQPVGYWRLNEADVDGVNNGRIADDYRGGCNGVYTNTNLGQPGYDPSTDPGVTSAFFGNNSAADNDAYAIGGVDFGSASGSMAFSVEAWIYGLSPQSKDAGIVSKGYRGAEQFCLDTGADGGVPNHAFRFLVRDAAGTAHIVNSTVAPTATYRSWHHLVGVCDEANGVVTFYVDGYAVGTAPISPGSGILGTTRSMIIGSMPSSATATANDLQLLQGYVNDVAVYNYALSASQVAAHCFSAHVPADLVVMPPANITVDAGGPLVIPALASGTSPLGYLWYDASVGATVATGTTNGNALNATLTVPNVPVSWDGKLLQLTVTNAYGSPPVASVSLSVASGAPQIVTDVQTPVLWWMGSSPSESVTAHGSYPLHYQWQHNGTNLVDDGRVTGSHSNALSFAYVQASDAGSYQVFVSNASGTNASSVAVAAVAGLPLGFGTDGVGWTANGFSGVAVANGVLALTDNAGAETRSFFFNYPQYIGAFKAAFTYQETLGDLAADGATFCIQNDPRGPAALGGGTTGLGYGGATAIIPSIALELNLYGGGETKGYRVLPNGQTGATSFYDSLSPVSLNSTDPIDITVAYAHGQMDLTFTDAVAHTSFSASLLVGDLPTLLGDSTAYVGFTGANRAGYVTPQNISNFKFVSLPTETIQPSGTNVIISWPAEIPGYTLQQNTNLATTSWVAVTNVPTVANGYYQATLSAGSRSLFYRLMLPGVP